MIFYGPTIEQLLFWGLVTVFIMWIWGKVDGTDRWYRKYQKELKRNYRPLK